MKIRGRKLAISFSPAVKIKKPKKVNNKELYPLYSNITYMGTATQFRADFKAPFLVEKTFCYKDFVENKESHANEYALIEDHIKLIKNAIVYELDEKQEQFQIKGLGKRLRQYELSVSDWVRKPLLVLDVYSILKESDMSLKYFIKEVYPLLDSIKDTSALDFISSDISTYLPLDISILKAQQAKKYIKLIVKNFY